MDIRKIHSISQFIYHNNSKRKLIPSEDISVLDSLAELISIFLKLEHLLMCPNPTSDIVHSLKSNTDILSCKN